MNLKAPSNKISAHKFDLIIFDCDGTLVDSHDVNHDTLLELLRENGVHAYERKEIDDRFLGSRIKNIQFVVEQEQGIKLPENFPQQFVSRVQTNFYTMLKPVEGARETIEALKEKYRLCVASNAHEGTLKMFLEEAGLLDCFQGKSIFAASMVRNPKPAPDLFLLAADKMGVDPARCLVIEDSGGGVVAGVDAGMEVWGFTGASHDEKRAQVYLKNAGASQVLDSLIHIPPLLGL